MHINLTPRLRHMLLAAWVVLAAALVVGLWPGGTRHAYAGDPAQPAVAVETDLTTQGYVVNDVGGPDTDPDLVDAVVVMEMDSDQLDQRVTAQLQAGWVALGTYYPDVPNLIVGLQYEQRYILVWAISNEDWNAWLGGDIPAEDFWDNVIFGVYDSVEQEYLSSGRDFLDKNFNDTDLPGPDPIDPGNIIGDPSSLVLDFSSLLINANDPDGATALARLIDEESRRVPGQTVTFTVTTRRVGAFGEKTVLTNEEGVARSIYVPAEGLEVPPGGVPVAITASGLGRINERQRLLIADFETTDTQASRQAAIDALEGAGYDVADFFYQEYPRPTGEVEIVAGPVFETASAQVDTAFFQEIKAGFGTSLAAFPAMTQVIVFQYISIERQVYWVVSSTTRDNWDSWMRGDRSEAEFWSAVTIDTTDRNFNSIDSRDFIDKNFGTGDPVTVQTSDSSVSYTATLVQEEWGPQNYYGEFSLPRTASMDNFSATLADGAFGWRLYEVTNLRDPVFDSETDDIDELVLQGGHYFLMVVADEPPASVTIKATMHVRY